MSTHSVAPLRRRRVRLAGAAVVSLVLTAPTRAAAQDVIEGETTVVNVRETDGRLGPLVTTLVTLGAGTLLATILFWWMTRPKRRHPGGTSHG